jgi:sigma-B regulation protein RsbU (phosphoserine phosphatase)
VTLDKPLMTVGRRTAADVLVAGPEVSRDHAEIAHRAHGYVLRDCGSRFGTFVNGERITEHLLANHDRIRLGQSDAVELTFVLDSGTTFALGDAASGPADFGQMAAILNGLRALGSGRVLDETLMLVLDSALDVTTAERGFVMLANARGELELKVARARGHVTLSGSGFATSAKIPREVFATGKSRIVADLMDDAAADAHFGTIAIGIRQVLCVPLVVAPYGNVDLQAGPDIIGVLYLDSREKTTLLSQAMRSTIEAFAMQAGLAIESARLYAESAEKGRLERDLRLAADIQQALLPNPTHQGGTFDLAATSVPCGAGGGDFFDYLDVADERFGFALGDVAGKGPSAALLAAAAQSNFVAQALVAGDPGEMMAQLNRALLRRAVDARFATMFYGELSPSGTLRYSNAGQEAPILVRTGATERLDAGGPVLGLIKNASYAFDVVQLAPGDLVVVYSDGVTEARNPANEEFGADRLTAAASGMRGQSPEAALDALVAAVRDFVGVAPPADDLTALVIRYTG